MSCQGVFLGGTETTNQPDEIQPPVLPEFPVFYFMVRVVAALAQGFNIINRALIKVFSIPDMMALQPVLALAFGAFIPITLKSLLS